MPVLLAKLWVVWPRFLSFPPVKRISHLVERIGLFPLVGGGIFMVFSGIANIAQWYPWRFAFPAAHYWVAWVTMGALVAHVGAKWAIARRALRRRRRPAWPKPTRCSAPSPSRPHGGLTRRGFLGDRRCRRRRAHRVTVGQTFGPLRRLALLAPRDPTVGPQGRPVNRSAANAGVDRRGHVAGLPAHRRGQRGPTAVVHLAELLRPPSPRGDPAHRLRRRVELLGPVARRARPRPAGHGRRRAGRDRRTSSRWSEQPLPRSSLLDHDQAHDRDTLLATHLDGQPLALDHGFPLRLIGPGRPGVIQTKWVTRLVGHVTADGRGAWLLVSAAAGWASSATGCAACSTTTSTPGPPIWPGSSSAAPCSTTCIFAPVVSCSASPWPGSYPARMRAVVQAALIVSGCLVLFSWPLVRGYAQVAAQPDLAAAQLHRQPGRRARPWCGWSPPWLAGAPGASVAAVIGDRACRSRPVRRPRS